MSFTFSSAFIDAYAYANAVPNDGSGTGPWGANQFNTFIFTCGTDSAAYVTAGDLLQYPDYLTYATTMPVTNLCGSGERDKTIWHKATTRASQSAACEEGASPSWAQWPNGGQGGWVCNKDEFAYGQ